MGLNNRFIKVTRYMCGKTIEVYFSGKVERVELKIKTTYRSFAGEAEEMYEFRRNKRDFADFYIECPNLECTEGYIDLRDEVNTLFKSREEFLQGEKCCNGKAAPDHLNQRCGAAVFFEIKIIYAE